MFAKTAIMILVGWFLSAVTSMEVDDVLVDNVRVANFTDDSSRRPPPDHGWKMMNRDLFDAAHRIDDDEDEMHIHLMAEHVNFTASSNQNSQCPHRCLCGRIASGHFIGKSGVLCRGKGLKHWPVTTMPSDAVNVDISKNFLEDIKTNRLLSDLYQLDASQNRLSFLTKRMFQYFPNLRFLYVNCNRITSIGLDTFTAVRYLTHLDISSIYWSNYKRACVSQVQRLSPDYQAVVRLFIALGKMKYIRVLHMRMIIAISRLEKGLLAYFKESTGLINLDLSSNAILYADRDAFAYVRNLRTLKMSYCSLRVARNQFYHLRNLRLLKLKNSDLKKFDLSQFLSRSPRLYQLNLAESIGIRCMDWLKIEISRTRIRILEMSCDTVGGVYTKLDLSKMHSLRYLSLFQSSPWPTFPFGTIWFAPNLLTLSVVLQSERQKSRFSRTTLRKACDFFKQLALASSFTLRKLRVQGTIIPVECSPIKLMLKDKNFLDVLYLPDNGITHLASDTFRGVTPILQYISLRANKLTSIPRDLFAPLQFLKAVDLSSNLLTVVAPDQFKALRGFWSLTLADNPLVCDCRLRDLRNWYRSGKIVFKFGGKGKSYYGIPRPLCFDPVNLKGIPVTDFELPWIECDNRKYIIIYSVVAFIVALILIAGIVAYIHRVDINFWRHFKRGKRKKKKKKKKLYDAYVSHALDDSAFVAHQMVPQLEQDPDVQFKLCLEFRDFPVGGYMAQNSIDAIYGSRWVIFIVSRAFVDSNWSNFEVNQAITRKIDENENMIIIVVIEDIPVDEMPDCLQSIIHHTIRFDYPASSRPGTITNFWRRLKLTLDHGSHSNLSYPRPNSFPNT
ncbi:toll-like receptor 1 [Tubulanus polymorphus]|uniref:toll-like receptor 1 n=1 Tax=Tubulanus polymorphus TaxID=672921 RepID=UPI003DA664B1